MDTLPRRILRVQRHSRSSRSPWPGTGSEQRWDVDLAAGVPLIDYSCCGEHGTLTLYGLGVNRMLLGQVTQPGGRPGSDSRLTIFLKPTEPSAP